MLASCSADIQAAVAPVDEVLLGRNPIATNLLKDLFGFFGV